MMITILSATACATPAATGEHARDPLPLARFMREQVSVPFAFAILESDGRRRPIRFERAAGVLKEAARDLMHWDDPPTSSDAARDVFFAYAQSLELHVARLETAAKNHDLGGTADQLESIRQTCNSCHRFFRPASSVSDDVAYDRYAVRLGSL